MDNTHPHQTGNMPNVHFSGGPKAIKGIQVFLVSLTTSLIVAFIVWILCFLYLAPILTPKIMIPSLTGMTSEQAQLLMATKGLSVVLEGEVENAEQKGRIVEQRPQPNSILSRGGTISVMLSKGLDLADVPVVVNLSQEDAQKNIVQAGFVVSGIDKTASADVPAGKVISTDPIPGTKLKKGLSVKLVVSAGQEKAKVPSVLGKTLDAAQTKIWAAGLKVGTVGKTCDETKEFGLILKQYPNPNAAVDKGSAVNVVVNTEAQE